MKEINEMVLDQSTYIESIGKTDRTNVAEALADNGADTTLRVCFGISGEAFPVRSLGYYASALAIHEKYMPEAQLQFIFPTYTAEKLNGVGISDAYSNIQILDRSARLTFGHLLRNDSPSYLGAEKFYDAEIPSDELIESVASVFGSNPKLAAPFEKAARKRNTGFMPYVSAHVLMHDTHPRLFDMPYEEADDEYIGTDDDFAIDYPLTNRVISIGAQSERPFYVARMAIQEAKILPADQQVATGQIFTKHVLPPYLCSSEGEPTLSYEMKIPDDIDPNNPVNSVQRDLEYLQASAGDAIRRYHGMTEVREISQYCVGRIMARVFV